MKSRSWNYWVVVWDDIFFKPRDTTACAVVRIAFGLTLLPYALILGLDLIQFHSETGLLPYSVSVALVDPDVL